MSTVIKVLFCSFNLEIFTIVNAVDFAITFYNVTLLINIDNLRVFEIN